MKILYDHQIFSMQTYGGISRYFVELVKQYQTIEGINTEISIKYSDNYYLKEMGIKCQDLNAPGVKKYKNKLAYGLNIINNLQDIKGNEFDVFHPTYYGCYYKNMLKTKPVIITVHDLTHEKYPEYFSNPKRNTELKKKAFERADKIIAISENTKKDVIEYFGINSDKIQVVYHGNSLKSVPINFKKYENLEDMGRYILYVGARGGYKNFIGFIKALAPTLNKDKELKIICAGGGTFKTEEIDLINKLRLVNQTVQLQVTDEMLIWLYENAQIFVFPSLYEGFGMPILEAMDCNCPVVLSNTSSFPEIAGNAAEYFDPKDEESIRVSIEKVIYNENYRSELRSLGDVRGKLFSWEITAKKTLEVYKEALK